MVGRRTLNPVVKVRVLVPQLQEVEPNQAEGELRQGPCVTKGPSAVRSERRRLSALAHADDHQRWRQQSRVVIAVYASKEAPTATDARLPLVVRQVVSGVEFGYIKSLTPLGKGYKLRLDLHTNFGPSKTAFRRASMPTSAQQGRKGARRPLGLRRKFTSRSTCRRRPTSRSSVPSLAPVRVTSQQFYDLEPRSRPRLWRRGRR